MTSTFTPEELRKAAAVLTEVSESNTPLDKAGTSDTQFGRHGQLLTRIADAIEEENKPKPAKVAISRSSDGGAAVYLETPNGGCVAVYVGSDWNGKPYTVQELSAPPEVWGTLINTEPN